MSGTAKKTMLIKIFAEKVLLSPPATIDELLSFLASSYNIPNPAVMYLDSEGLHVTVSTQAEYEDVLALTKRKLELTAISLDSLRKKKGAGADDFNTLFDLRMTESRYSQSIEGQSACEPVQLRSIVDPDFASLLNQATFSDTDSESDSSVIKRDLSSSQAIA
mmetsp:Transcript_6095/g.10706  ORF Transcript_6095/g.10706 Transcript_6095/m.10706 type:complete len:163 (-) Transcript_6095:87-575(-)